MQRREFLRLAAGVAGTAVLGSHSAKAAAAKPQKLNLLYATAEADSEAVKLVLPDFASKLGIKLNLETFPYAALQQKVFAELASNWPPQVPFTTLWSWILPGCRLSQTK
jgi:multiple sugar transport system substrate-binding protein